MDETKLHISKNHLIN